MKHCKQKFPGWLLTVPLFINIFTCAAYVKKENLAGNYHDQTELLYRSNIKYNQVFFAFKIKISAVSTNSFYIHSTKYAGIFLQAFNELIKVKFDSNSGNFFSIPPFGKFLRLKHIPENSDTDFIICIG